MHIFLVWRAGEQTTTRGAGALRREQGTAVAVDNPWVFMIQPWTSGGSGASV